MKMKAELTSPFRFLENTDHFRYSFHKTLTLVRSPLLPGQPLPSPKATGSTEANWHSEYFRKGNWICDGPEFWNILQLYPNKQNSPNCFGKSHSAGQS